MALVLVEARWEPGLDEATFLKGDDGLNHCLAEREIRWLYSYLSPDGTRSICCFEAPDAESVRESYRRSQQPFERIWPAHRLAPE